MTRCLTQLISPAARRGHQRDSPRLRLVACPPAGAGASYFRPLIAPEVELWSARYPGRESRLSEPLASTVDALAEEIVADFAVLPANGLPTVLLGHSLGAAVAAEVAARLTARDRRPDLLVLSAKEAPGGSGRERLRRIALDDELLLDWMAELGGTPNSLLTDAGFMAMQLPIMRADLLASLSVDALPDGAPLDLPLLLLCGDADPVVAVDSMTGWAALVTGDVTGRTLSGGHHAVVTDVDGTHAAIAACSRS